MTKFVDCFLFNDELDLLEFRLTEHDSFTDYFILVESKKSFSAKPKKLYATNNIERFHKWKDKLIIVIVDENEISKRHGFDLEDYSRECAIKKVQELYETGLFDSNTIVSCVSDTDEIYDKDKIEELKNSISKPIRPLLQYHYYSLKITRPNNTVWTPQKRLKIVKITDLKEFTIKEVQEMTITDIKEMGWHLCYFGGIDLILSKLSNFAHSNMGKVRECISNPDLIKYRLENNIDILGREWEKLELKEPNKVPININLLKELKIDLLI